MGGTTTATANVTVSGSTYKGGYEWMSSDTTIASVTGKTEGTAIVTGRKYGEVRISCTCNGVTGTSSVLSIGTDTTHYIYIQWNTANSNGSYYLCELYFHFTNTDSTRYTTIAEVAAALIDLGYTGGDDWLDATGTQTYTATGDTWTFNGVYGYASRVYYRFTDNSTGPVSDSTLESAYQHAMGDVGSASLYPAAPVIPTTHTAVCGLSWQYSDIGGALTGTWTITVETSDKTAYTSLADLAAGMYALYGTEHFTVTGTWADTGTMLGGASGNITEMWAVSSTSIGLHLDGYGDLTGINVSTGAYNATIDDTVTNVV